MTESRKLSNDGYEMMFAVNHLAHFLLTDLLLPLLKKSTAARIVNVSSAGHKAGRFALDNLQGERFFSGFPQYCTTKLLNILFTTELVRRLAQEGVGNITVNALHPGVVRTAFATNNSGFLMRAWDYIGGLFMISATEGAQTSIFLCTSEAVANTTGEYFAKSAVAKMSAAAKNTIYAQQLWAYSERLV